jgi:glycosyltransferase 2 family protein
MMDEQRQAATLSTSPGHWLRWLVRHLGPLLGVAAIAGLVLVLNPGQVWRALSRFDLRLLPVIVVLYAVVYVLQGARWHFLLREAGVRLTLSDSVLLNAAGQTITALVPLGDLTRAAFAAEASRRDFGTVAATVTVQELTYTLSLVLLALPGLLALHLGFGVLAATVAGMVAIAVVLTVPPVFCLVHRLIARIPLLNRLLPAIDELQQETVQLLHRPETLSWSVLDLARAVASIAAFWLVVQGVAPGRLDWWEAAFALALSSIGGAISLLPGGVGANEASVAGLLILLGVPGGAAGAAALVQRLMMTGMALLFGLSAYAFVNRRFDLGGLFQVTAREPARRAA